MDFSKEKNEQKYDLVNSEIWETKTHKTVIKKAKLYLKDNTLNDVSGVSRYIQYLESLILAQDERWRRA